MADEPRGPFALPLQGSRLVEASAGTGKTWTIAALYLRLMLVPYAPGEVVVMSFTRAATRELAGRIRERLGEAAALLRASQNAAPHATVTATVTDPFLTDLLIAYPAGPAREQAAWRAAAAADAMDDAAVFTIDAWCQRMLREHAFDSGSPFAEDVQADEETLLQRAVHDWWRAEVYGLDDAALALVLAQWPTVQALLADMRETFVLPVDWSVRTGTAGAAPRLAEVAHTAAARSAAALAAAKRGWAQRAVQMRRWLLANAGSFAGSSLTARNIENWTGALERWAEDPTLERLELKTGAQRLVPSWLLAHASASPAPELPAFFAELEALLQSLPALPRPRAALREHAARAIHARLQALKQQAETWAHTDMLHRLDAALDPARHGARADALRERILAQHPVALIDEFQDTSPVQLRIFDRLWRIGRIGNGDPTRLLLLIGDPKQAIYAFRGADIHSYLAAREATTGRHHVLDTNRRSTAALVAAVNALFGEAEVREAVGAFRFGRERLPFVPARAHGRADRFVTAGGTPPALHLLLDATLQNKSAHLERQAAACAARIVALLTDAHAGFVEAPDADAGAAAARFTRLRPADIAVLVRDAVEAGAVRGALRRGGVASVYLSDRDSVFDSAEATDLLHLLHAMAAPGDTRRLRAALATALFARTPTELLRLADDDMHFDSEAERLREMAALARRQGAMALVRALLHRFELPARWPADGTRDRRLTNVLHLAELLQAASTGVAGPAGLVRWLAQHVGGRGESIATSGGIGDERTLRLESDAGLVQVVTVHKSKGLEYPLVFVPFAGAASPARKPRSVRWVDRQQAPLAPFAPGVDGTSRLSLDPDRAALAEAAAERAREDVRLLYVALTRARHVLWVGASTVQDGPRKSCAWHQSALGWLVSGAAPRTPEQVAADVRKWAAATPGVELHELTRDENDGQPEPTPVALQRLEPLPPLPPLAPPVAYRASFERDWTVASFTAIVRDTVPLPDAARGAEAQPGRADEFAPEAQAQANVEVEPEAGPGVETAVLPSPAEPWHLFPRGAGPGTFLHGLLETLAAEGFDRLDHPRMQAMLRWRIAEQGFAEHQSAVLAWLAALATRELPALGTSLHHAAAATASRLVEMEFWLPAERLPVERVDALCRQHLLPGTPRPALPPRVLHGLLMGFADLVFEHGGRWWVLDYKSNALGGKASAAGAASPDGAYSDRSLRQAVAEHRYDVQAAIYLLALHRLLRQRLGAAYVPARHLGGAIFWFLRGVAAPNAGCCTLDASPDLLAALDTLLDGAPSDAGAETARAGS